MSLRYLLHDDEHPFSEAIGVVMAVRDEGADDEASIEVMTRRGERIELRKSDIVAAKVFPI